MSEDIVAMAREALALTIPAGVSATEYVNRLFTAYMTLSKTVPEILDRLDAAEQVTQAAQELEAWELGEFTPKSPRELRAAIFEALDAYRAVQA